MGSVLSGRSAIVTGGSAGLGLALAGELLARGVWVLIVGRDRKRLDAALGALRQRPGAEVDALAADVSRREDMQGMAQAALARRGRIDILVAAAGILRASAGRIGTVLETPTSDFDQLLSVNLKGTFLSNQAVLPSMIRRGAGQIVNVSSTSALRGHAFDAAYCASKFAVLALTRSLAEEVRHFGVRVQAVLPGPTESAIWEQNGPIPRPRHVLPVERLVRSIVTMLELPADAVLPQLVVQPEGVFEAPRWLRGGDAARGTPAITPQT